MLLKKILPYILLLLLAGSAIAQNNSAANMQALLDELEQLGVVIDMPVDVPAKRIKYDIQDDFGHYDLIINDRKGNVEIRYMVNIISTENDLNNIPQMATLLKAKTFASNDGDQTIEFVSNPNFEPGDLAWSMFSTFKPKRLMTKYPFGTMKSYYLSDKALIHILIFHKTDKAPDYLSDPLQIM